MNFGPNYPKNPSGLQIDGFLNAGFTDVWVQAISDGNAIANWGDRDSNGSSDMPLASLTSRTHDSRRIDYFFFKNGSPSLSVNEIEIPDLRANCPHGLVNNGGTLPACTPEVTQLWDTPDDFGVRPSDHNFVKTTFEFSSILLCKWSTSPACQ